MKKIYRRPKDGEYRKIKCRGNSTCVRFESWLIIESSTSQSASLPQSKTQDEGLPATMLQRVVSKNIDAMNLLFEAALCEEPREASARREQNNSQISWTMNEVDTVQVWKAHRFVKMGWFTAKEAMTLVDLYVIYPFHCTVLRHASSHIDHFREASSQT